MQTEFGELTTEPARTQMWCADMRELLMEASFIGVVALTLVLLVAWSPGVV
ncbi:hypothetical protein [Variovorax sp. KK3]|uniref:hypothetical protein n=1 Tax=Variovorax sp. KK3 TaxID=1855728 RepID=UPI0015C37F7F|nr:hypothetical protein [Variovorax sp. KK3]